MLIVADREGNVRISCAFTQRCPGLMGLGYSEIPAEQSVAPDAQVGMLAALLETLAIPVVELRCAVGDVPFYAGVLIGPNGNLMLVVHWARRGSSTACVSRDRGALEIHPDS
jgi:hypothetical protein